MPTARWLPRSDKKPRIAVIDGGFWLDTKGQPVSGVLNPSINLLNRSDLPAGPTPTLIPLQWDFVNNDSVADGMNGMLCTGGTICQWHGNRTAAVAAGILNNQYGEAGTGGQVSDIVLLKIAGTCNQLASALRTAVEYGADIINMSLGVAYYSWIYNPEGGPLEPIPPCYAQALAEARAYHVVLVASAGNDSKPVHSADEYVDTRYYPCMSEGVICVGALNDNTTSAIFYSNYGDEVTIWAPTNIPVMPDLATPGVGTANPSATSHGGTSASAPFVSGVIAMMKALTPSLTPEQIRTILIETAWKPNAGEVPAINAYQAVLRATDNRLPPDIFDRTVSRNNSPEAANFLKVGRSYDLSIQDFADVDYYQIDVPPYSDVQIQLFYVPALGTLHLAPGRADWDKSLKPDGELITSSSVLEGKYEFSVYSPDKIPNIYDVSVNINPVGLQPDEFDIVPPYNNTIWNSGVLNFAATDNYGVTLHVPSDVDWYRFSVPSAPKSKFPLHFHLSMASDFAVATWIIDDKSTEPVFSDVTDSVDLRFQRKLSTS